MQTNETQVLWPTFPNRLGYEFNCSGDQSKENTFSSSLCSSCFPIWVSRNCLGAPLRTPLAGPRPGEEAPIPNPEERWRYVPASHTTEGSAAPTSLPQPWRRRGLPQIHSDIGDFFFFFNCRKGGNPDFSTPNTGSCWGSCTPKSFRYRLSARETSFTFVSLLPSPHSVCSVRVRTNAIFISLRNRDVHQNLQRNSLWVEGLFSEILEARCFWDSEFSQFQKGGKLHFP